MSGPRIKVRLGHSPVLRKIHNAWVNQGWRRKFYWHCTGCTSQFESNGGTADALAAAADAGRAHLAEHHAQGYCRLHGAHRSVCGCRVASVDPEPLFGPESGSCEFACRSCGHLKRWHGVSGGRCHQRGGDSSRCDCREFVDNPLQTAHNQSREDC